MKYRAGERRKAIEYEKAITEWWKKNKTFEQSVEQRPIDKSYVFYDGPPFITGNPHHGTLLSSIVKDAVPRYWTMNGYRVERRWGWDCHGLPAENFVEKQLGITDRREIGTKWSLEDYIIKARESMVANSETWRSTIDRVGRWVDFDNCYRTMNKDFMESVWWAFKQLYDAGKIYEGRKVLMYDTKFATPVSKAEVTMDNDAYQTVTDPSAYVKFRIVASENSLSRGMRDDGSVRSEEPHDDGRDEASRDKNISVRNHTIKKVTEDIYKYNFNTAVAALMEYVNELYKVGTTQEDLITLAKLLKPFAPHLASEMLEHLDATDEWPTWDEKYLVADTAEVVIQVNGKLRSKITVDTADLDDEAKIISLALADSKITKYTENGIKKTIFIKKAKLLNIVI